ncbi:hypothetical protein HN018_23340 (plasmid) [Lichenicola cladoniae]|uniref:Uncharacterized protein n=1 Tax=Lichenicola cladoniae TaxID=1484109 RepID=A0A6M8HYG1_9PROT|nr:hypothetical protein [Lichenicola cladoniae]NPD66346.1 hypothetical protein [Acetobacteraceae bacterium]QKE93121.1 hypothetical protein HN018_23340 [Lichenicola cladoniae]
MDTHITGRPELQDDRTEAGFSHVHGDRIAPENKIEGADEGSPAQHDTTSRPEIVVDGIDEVFDHGHEGVVRHAPGAMGPFVPVKRHRNGLMITACTIAVLVVGGGVFWISPYNHSSVADLTRRAGGAGAALNPNQTMLGHNPAPVAPAARLARAPEPSGGVAALPRPTPVTAAPHPGGDEMAEFLRLGGQTPAAPHGSEKRVDAPAVASAPAADPHLPPAASDPPKPSSPVSVAVVAPEPVQHPAATAAAPKDAVAAIAALRPAPMTDAQQVQVLDLVTQLGTLVRDQRAQIAQLRQDQQNLGERVDGSLSDFTRRISLSEARGALGAASGEARVPPAAAPPPSVAPVVARVPVPVAATTPADTGPHRYHVQAASPGLAMLSELDASGGEARQLPISPGDTVPGWGKVVSIAQRGTAWVVKTDRGVIQ